MTRSPGFTFVELMIAASIFAIVAVAIYSTFGAGISAWRRTETTQTLYQDLRLTLHKIAQDLENAVLYSKESEFFNFLGENNRISFYSLANIYRTMPAHPELRKITYSLDESRGILQRLEQTFPESIQQAQGQQPEEIASKIKRLNFFYCYQDEAAEPSYKWKDAWDSAQGIPQGVKIELELETDEKAIFTKYVFIPIGEKAKEE